MDAGHFINFCIGLKGSKDTEMLFSHSHLNSLLIKEISRTVLTH